MPNSTVQLVLDRLAVGLSAACALHCALAPIALVALPVLAGSVLADEGFHLLMLWLILPSSTVALTLGCRRHKDAGVLVAGVLGLAVLVFSAVLGHNLLGELGEKLLTFAGAAVLCVGHLRNYRLCRRNACDH